MTIISEPWAAMSHTNGISSTGYLWTRAETRISFNVEDFSDALAGIHAQVRPGRSTSSSGGRVRSRRRCSPTARWS